MVTLGIYLVSYKTELFHSFSSDKRNFKNPNEGPSYQYCTSKLTMPNGLVFDNIELLTNNCKKSDDVKCQYTCYVNTKHALK